MTHKVPVQSLIDHIKTAIDVDPWAKGMAEELLKEKEPVKPTWRQGKAYCGQCGQKMPRKCDGIERRYCSFCGQAVKWE
jgi:NADH pyrophosphatase NudC (nudix superfamily)